MNKVNISLQTREQWLAAMADILMTEILDPVIAELNLRLPRPPVRFSTSQPSGRKGGRKILGVCYTRASSQDGKNEIFICATHETELAAADTLLHELIHAYTDCKGGHGGQFKQIAFHIGMARQNNKPGTEHCDGDLLAYLDMLVKRLPAIPAAPMNDSKKPKEKSRLIKVECDICEFKFYTSRTQIERMATRQCNCCGENSLTIA